MPAAAAAAAEPSRNRTGDRHGDGRRADDIYRVYFHGPAYQVLERSWRKATARSACWPGACRPTTVRATCPRRAPRG